MPNHVTNILRVSGNPEKVRAMFEAIKDDKIGLGSIDFNKVIPMPEHIFRGNLGMAEREKYGEENWYNWSISNWGTKWNSYGYDGAYTPQDFDGEHIEFQTAWSRADPVIRTLAEQYSRLLGYEKGEDGQPQVVPEEAEIVKRIFRSYYSGASVRKIKESLEADNILSPTGKQEWSVGVLQYMLRNERYIGDALLQKTYVVDCLTKETRKNNGEIPQYYVTGNHEPIISKDLFNLVQEEIARRAGKRKVAKKAVKTEKGKYSSKYALTELLCCGDCGTQYRRVTWARNGKKKVVWRCINRLEYGTKYCKESPTIEESRLHQGIVTALNRLDEDKADVIETLKAGLQLAIGMQDDDSFNKVAVQNRIAELQSVMMDLVELSSKTSAGADYFDAKFEEIAAEIKGLQNQLGEHQEQTMLAQNTQARIHELLYTLEHIDLSVKEYRDDVVKGIITKVVVLSADRIRITFDNNMEMEQDLPGE